MGKLTEISESTTRRIDQFMFGMAECDSLEELEGRFLGEAGKIVPGDCLGWNNWKPDWSDPISFRLTPGYAEWFSAHTAEFGEVVGYHPVIKAGCFQRTTEGVLRMSDFQAPGQFKSNPLFLEVYRHLDSHYQISYAAGLLTDRRIILTWNRRLVDFNDRDRQTFHYLGLRLGLISHHVAERQRLDRSWNQLCNFVDARLAAGSVKTLASRDVGLLTKLLKGRTVTGIAADLDIRRDTVDKRLGMIREHLGLENQRQLLSALAEFKRSRRTKP